MEFADVPMNLGHKKIPRQAPFLCPLEVSAGGLEAKGQWTATCK